MGKVILIAAIFYIVGAMYPGLWNTIRAKVGV